MNKGKKIVITEKLLILFKDPFWIGVFEHVQDGKLSVCKVTFGTEPKEYEIQEFILREYDKLKISPAIESEKLMKEHINPKRLQREVKRQLHNVGIGTKSQQALKLQQEQQKTERKACSKQKYVEEQKRIFELKQQKKREKHRGR